jgi:hypothetical protein
MRTNELIRAILEAEDDDFDTKDLESIPDPDPDLVARAIRHKSIYLGLPFVLDSAVQHTNPTNETYLFGQFGTRLRRNRNVMATLLYYDPEHGWQYADPAHISEADDFDMKDLEDEEPGKPNYLPLGSVSSGTLRPEDLISAFLSTLEDVDPQRASAMSKQYSAGDEIEDEDGFIAELEDALQDHCPPYTYFGGHPGDGADFGVWVSDETIEDALRDEPEKIQAIMRGEPRPLNVEYVVVKDASGENVALLDGATGAEIWST